MNKINIRLNFYNIIALSFFLSLTILSISFNLKVVRAEEVVKKTILIDPGHGGIDGGAISKRGTVEKDINLSISLKLKEKLINDGFNVVMTREEDKGLYTEKGSIRNKKNEDLSERCKMKDTSNCDVFISIHLNSFPQSQYSGAQVWYANNEESKKIAYILQKNLRNDLNNNNKRVEKSAMDGYKILRNSKIPAIIVECGFLSNEEEENKLKTEQYQDKIADSLNNSVKEYFGIF